MFYILFFCGLFMLLYGANLLIDGSKLLAEHLGVSKLVIGITLIAFGTSLPEFIVSLNSIPLPDYNEIVVGNIVGSNIANIGLVFGFILLIKPMEITNSHKMFFNVLIMIFSTFIFSIYLINGRLSNFEGYSLIFILFIYLIILVKKFSRSKIDNQDESRVFHWENIIFVFSGFLLVSMGSDLFLDSAKNIAELFNINMLVFSVLIIALATSLPELITSLVAIYKNEPGLSIGNLIGSNIINILLVGGFSSSIKSIDLNIDIFNNNLSIMIVLALLLFLTQLFCKKVGKVIGLLYLFIYIYFIVLEIFSI